MAKKQTTARSWQDSANARLGRVMGAVREMVYGAVLNDVPDNFDRVSASYDLLCKNLERLDVAMSVLSTSGAECIKSMEAYNRKS